MVKTPVSETTECGSDFSENRFLGRLRHAELNDLFRGDLDLLTSGRIATDASLPVDEDQLADARKSESVDCFAVRKASHLFQNAHSDLLFKVEFAGEMRSNLTLGH